MISIKIICVGKIKENYLKEAIAEYSKRLSKYCKLNIIEIEDEKIPSKTNPKIINEIKNIEGNKILLHLKNSYNIALDLNGSQLTSENFSNKIQNIALNQSSSISFIIGGTLGLSDEVLSACNEKISFSKMTFPHQLFRVLLLEQLFRAFKISNHETYHW